MSDYDAYCRIEVFCFYKTMYESYIGNTEIDDYLTSQKDRCLDIQGDEYFNDVEDYDVFATEYDNVHSAIDYLVMFEQFWREFFQKSISVITDGDPNICLSCLRYNRWQKSYFLLMYEDSWMMTGVSCYTKENEDNQRKFAHILWQSQRIYVGYDPQYTECIERELIPRDKVILLLKEILDTNNFQKHINTYKLPIKDPLISPDELPF